MSLQGKQILVVTSVYPLSETTDRYGSFIHETVLYLQITGMKISVFASAYKGSKNQVLDGIKVHRFRYFFKPWENLTHGEGAPTKIQNPFYFLISAFYIIFGSWQLFWKCYHEKPDLLHIHWPFPHGLMAFPSHKLLHIPMVFSCHGAELLLAKKMHFVGNILTWLLPQADGITANSSFTSGLIRNLYDGRVAVIPYGLTITVKESKQSLNNEVPRLLFVGRLIERKGLKYLLEAMPMILERHPVRLRVVGDGSAIASMKSLCNDLNISHAVDFLGFVDHDALVDEYANCDIFVLPSIIDAKGDTEGLGIVMIEALAHAKPVVASSVGGIVDVVRSGVTGYLVPERNSKVLAAGILKLLFDPKLAKEMGKLGCQDIQERFGWDHILSLWQKVFIDVFEINPQFNSLMISREK